MQMRWAKTDSALTGGTDTWNLFYQTDSSAVGTGVAWQNAGVDYTFAANGQMSPAVPIVTLSGVTVDGVSLGTVVLQHGSGGLTQFADANGNVQVNTLQQNGFPAGILQSVSVNDKGRVVGTFSNSRTIDLAQITLANFKRRRRPQAHRRRRVRCHRRFRPADVYGARQDRRLLARGIQHRHRRRIHQADRDPAGLLRQHQGDHDQQPDGPGSPEHAAVTARGRDD
jgi:hypothetical protein